MNIKLLAEELEHRGITKEELARECGITPNVINGIFLGNRTCTIENAKRIADKLSMSSSRAVEVFLKA